MSNTDQLRVLSDCEECSHTKTDFSPRFHLFTGAGGLWRMLLTQYINLRFKVCFCDEQVRRRLTSIAN